MPTTDPKRTTLASVEREIEALERRRAALDRAIARLQGVAASLRADRSAGDGDAPASFSLTNHCRALLRMHAPGGLTPRDVKRLLTETGFDWDRYANPMAAIHTVLKRLTQQGEAKTLIDRNGERRYALIETRFATVNQDDLRDQKFLDRLLEADSPEAILQIIRSRRPK